MAPQCANTRDTSACVHAAPEAEGRDKMARIFQYGSRALIGLIALHQPVKGSALAELQEHARTLMSNLSLARRTHRWGKARPAARVRAGGRCGLRAVGGARSYHHCVRPSQARCRTPFAQRRHCIGLLTSHRVERVGRPSVVGFGRLQVRSRPQRGRLERLLADP